MLIVHSVESTLPAVIILDNSIRQEMQSQLPGRLEIFSEFLDAERFPEPERDERMASFLKDKYAKQPIDLVIVTAAPALNLLLQRRAWLFSDTPILFSRIREENELLRSLPPGVTGITSHLNPVPTVELALHLQPNARHLVVVTGTSEIDREWEETARRTLKLLRGQVAGHLPCRPADRRAVARTGPTASGHDRAVSLRCSGRSGPGISSRGM